MKPFVAMPMECATRRSGGISVDDCAKTEILRWNRAKRSDGKVRLFNYDSIFDSDHAIRSGVVPGV